MDCDYANKLNNEEKRFLSNFNEEYYGGNFNHPGKQLHKTKAMKKDCYDRNNARNRDAFGILKIRGSLLEFSELSNLGKSQKKRP
jgi:hypothetical protein